MKFIGEKNREKKNSEEIFFGTFKLFFECTKIVINKIQIWKQKPNESQVATAASIVLDSERVRLEAAAPASSAQKDSGKVAH